MISAFPPFSLLFLLFPVSTGHAGTSESTTASCLEGPIQIFGPNECSVVVLEGFAALRHRLMIFI